MSVLIITMPGDYHAHAVRWALRELGCACETLYPLDLADGAFWSWEPGADVLKIEYRGYVQRVHLAGVKSVWMRRPPGILPQESLTDAHERSVAEIEFHIFASSVLKLLGETCFVCNRLDSTNSASMKPFQFAAAERVGLNMPRTLISNSPHQIEKFFEECGGRMVYKPVKAAAWVKDNLNMTIVPTTIISDHETLQGCNLAAAPGIYQELIPKQIEVRATVMGRTIFAWEKSFERRGPETLDVDWRWMHREAVHRCHALPDEIAKLCFALLEELDLVFGCFDFVIDGTGVYYFLEVNPQGQWLWGDSLGIGLNQLEGMAEFLMAGDTNFQYSRQNSIHLCDVPQDLLEEAMAEEARQHHGDLLTFNYDRISFRYVVDSPIQSSAVA